MKIFITPLFAFIFVSFIIINACNNNNNNKKEIKENNSNVNAKIDIKVFSNDTVKDATKLSGYGYDIYMNDARYIHQPNIPAINGERGFKTKEQAEKAGVVIIFKIRHNIIPPTLSINELDSLKLLK